MEGNELRKEKLKQKVDEAKKVGKDFADGAIKTVKGIAHWCVENPKEATLIGSALMFGKKLLTKTAEEKEYDKKRCRYWDGTQIWYLKRELRTSEKLELERRRQRGELAGNILAEMRVLEY